MLIHGRPLAVAFSSDPDIGDRFWFWSGASGRRYIHSVFAVSTCPPLPGASYVAVKRQGILRIAIGVGRLSPFWEQALNAGELLRLQKLGVDELHVHLLAKSAAERDFVIDDLAQALEDGRAPDQGFSDDAPAFSPLRAGACAAAA